MDKERANAIGIRTALREREADRGRRFGGR